MGNFRGVYIRVYATLNFVGISSGLYQIVNVVIIKIIKNITYL